ncbi:hypothetical protein G7Y79_00068g096190 [Physcia stellaris]|nr:hypothetical protein G7Y79_00068g096190 [Physcia stellaris]
MASNSMPAFLAKLDDDTRNRYIRAKAVQGIDVTKPRVQVPAVTLPNYHDEAHGFDITRAPTMGNPESRRFPSYQASIALESIYDCTEKGQSEQYLLESGAEIDEMVAAVAGRAKSLPIFEAMVRAGWDANAPIGHGHTVLAMLVEDINLVEWFLQQGADPNLGGPGQGNADAENPLTNSGACLYQAAAKSTPAVIELLLRGGAKMENSRPLHAAVRRGKEAIPMLEYLLDLGCDIESLADPCDQFSVGTPLESVIRHGLRHDSLAIAKFLLEKGADPRPSGRRGIDVYDEPIRSQLQEIHERATVQNQSMHDQ